MSHNEYENNKETSQYKSDMEREEKDSRKIAKKFKAQTGFYKSCKQYFKV